MKITKILALILAVIMAVLPLAACGTDSDGKKDDGAKEKKTDLEYVQDKGKLVIGMTEYPPMNYRDDNGEWIGFDTEFAYLVADELGVEVEFVEIVWNTKWFALETKDIDCVWNGMTLTDEAQANASCTDTYVINAQTVVVKADKDGEYVDADSLKGKKVAVEVESAGLSAAEAAGFDVVEYPSQADAIMAVETGKAEACVIDITMANNMTGEGKTYKNLKTAFTLTEEEYAIACRKGSDITEKINEIMQDLIDDGTLATLADKYELTLVAEAE